MEEIYATKTASITELKKQPTTVIDKAEGKAVAILNHNKPTAYLIPAKTYEALMEKVEDYELGKIVKERAPMMDSAIEVSLDEL